MLEVSVVILTFNEALHIERCIASVKAIAKEIIVVDSESTDNTVAIAENLGAKVYVHKWPGNQAAQFNWALDNIDIKGEWIFRIDADEYITKELEQELQETLPSLDKSITGILIPRQNYWMQRNLNRGKSNIKILRIFRNGYGRSEARLMDEHIILCSGQIAEMTNTFVDDNLNNLGWWTNKHVNYAGREAAELLDIEYNLSGKSNTENLENLSKDARQRRELKLKYAKQPLFWRTFAYFLYRYFLKGGFLEGKAGFLRHFLQGWWYRTLVDAMIYEIKQKSGGDPQKVMEILSKEFGIDFSR